ncbi:MAG: FtsL-like putative cell division protein [Bacteroidales bacterium]
MTGNRFVKQDKEAKAKRTNGGFTRFVGDLLDGSMLTRNTTSSVMPFILYLSVLGLFLIFNAYHVEKKIREVEQLREEMTEWRIRYIQTKSAYMYMTSQSEITETLKARGFISPDEPPQLLYDPDDQKGFFERLLPKNW